MCGYAVGAAPPLVRTALVRGGGGGDGGGDGGGGLAFSPHHIIVQRQRAREGDDRLTVCVQWLEFIEFRICLCFLIGGST